MKESTEDAEDSRTGAGWSGPPTGSPVFPDRIRKVVESEQFSGDSTFGRTPAMDVQLI